ncbi:polysaccharide pyruvyl transferase family protein [Fusobacterium sp. MFO224]|uniref:polysaccharide pyruvyl transferase family protein n=1 Tax=Fusobacterium sp. MFO224 TaxID=3378070 RepID=UPI003851A4F4
MLKNIKEKIRLHGLKKYRSEKKIIFLLSPEHGNLGDEMIAVATEKILKDKYGEKRIIEIPRKSHMKNKEMIRDIINKNDIIFLPGGGNLGDIWLGEEISRRQVIEEYKNNKIIIMPQTIKFLSEKEKNISQKIYSEAEDLTIITREKESFKMAKEIFDKNKILLAPDTVFYLEDDYVKNLPEERDGVIMLMRNDQEKIITSIISKKIKSILKSKNLEIKESGTVVDSRGRINLENREEICLDLLKDISKHKLVITDRLHGMIFAVITNTPALVFGSSTHKTEGTLKWISHLNYISFVDDPSNLELIEKEIERLSGIKVKKDKYLVKEELMKVINKL